MGLQSNKLLGYWEVKNADRLNNLIASAFEQANFSVYPQGPMRARLKAVDDDNYENG